MLRYSWVFFAKVILVTYKRGDDVPVDEGKLLWAARPSR